MLSNRFSQFRRRKPNKPKAKPEQEVSVNSKMIPYAEVWNKLSEKKKKKFYGKKTKKISKDVASDVAKTFNLMLKDPITLVFFFCSVSVIVAHYSGIDKGFLKDFINTHKGNNTFVKWISDNERKFLGLVAYAPVAYTLPTKYRMVISGFVVGWIFVLKALPVHEYVIISGIVLFYLKTQNMQTKLFCIIAGSIAFFMGYLSLGKT